MEATYESFECSNFTKVEKNLREKPKKVYFLVVWLLVLVILKVLLGSKRKAARKTFSQTFVHLTALLLSPINIVLIIFFAILRETVHILLYLKVREKFGGLLNGTDNFWAINDTSNMIINIVLIINYNASNSKQLVDLFRSTVKEKLRDQLKFNCIKQSFLGYNYLLKDDLNVEQNIRIFNTQNECTLMSVNELQEFVSEIGNKPLPNDNRSLWECLIGEKPIKWNANKKRSLQYPIVVRFNHTLSDAAGLIHFLLSCFMDNPMEKSEERTRIRMSGNYLTAGRILCLYLVAGLKCLAKLGLMFRGFLYGVYVLTVKSNANLVKQLSMEKKRFLDFDGELLGEQILVWNVEDRNLVGEVKKTKNRLGCTFSSILSAAISKSLHNFYEYKSIPKPKQLSAVVPISLNATSISLNNDNFSVISLNIPVSESKMGNCERISRIMADYRKISHLAEHELYYLFLKIICRVLPQPVLKKAFLASNTNAMVISNVPGIKRVSILNGCILDDILFWVPNKSRTDLGFSILTYNDRFQLGLIVDKRLISSKDEAQMLIDSVYQNIGNICKEI